jgi:hypothetical protein
MFKCLQIKHINMFIRKKLNCKCLILILNYSVKKGISWEKNLLQQTRKVHTSTGIVIQSFSEHIETSRLEQKPLLGNQCVIL